MKSHAEAHAEHRRRRVIHDFDAACTACGTQEWEHETLRPIIDIARREGVMIRPREAA